MRAVAVAESFVSIFGIAGWAAHCVGGRVGGSGGDELISCSFFGTVCRVPHSVGGYDGGSGGDELFHSSFLGPGCRVAHGERECDGDNQFTSGLRGVPSDSSGPYGALSGGDLSAGFCSTGTLGFWRRVGATSSYEHNMGLVLRRALGPGSPARQGARNE